MYEPPHHHRLSNEGGDDDDKRSPSHSRTTIHWQANLDSGTDVKEQINTDTQQFDALFARSNASPPPSPHPRCYSSCSPSTMPFQVFNETPSHPYAKSQPHLTSSSAKPRADRRQSLAVVTTSSTTPPLKSQQYSNLILASRTAQMKRKNFSLTHAAQAFLQSNHSPCEQLEPLARSCSYKRPQSMKKYRQQKKAKEQKEYSAPLPASSSSSSSRKYSITPNNNVPRTVILDSARKSISGATPRISTSDLMANDEQWSSPKTRRSARIGSLPLDQLQLPHDGDEEIYRLRQFNTTSKGFVNRGDSFKRSFKRSGSTSRRGSFRKIDRTPSQEQVNESEPRTSNHSLTNNNLTVAAGPNLNGILDTHFIDTSAETNEPTLPADIDDDDDDDDPRVECIETVDGILQDIRVYQIYLLGMSGTGKCSLIRQFKTTEYRGIYEYSSSLEDDPDNTISIMLDGIESRLHIINIDVDLIKCSVTGDAFVVVYSITDRPSFQTAVQLIKNIRDKEMSNQHSSIKRHVPIILVGNKSDLVRKRSVTKETARHAAFRYDCKFVETSAAINDKVDDLLAGTLKQIRIGEYMHSEQRRRLTVTNGTAVMNDLQEHRLVDKRSSSYNRNSKNVFSKFLNVFRKKPSKLPADVENLNTGIQ